MIKKIVVALLVLFLAAPAFAERTMVEFYGRKGPPNKCSVYVHPTYDYYIHLGIFKDVLADEVDQIISYVDDAFEVWGLPVIPRFMGLSECPGTYNDGVNTIDFGIIRDDEGVIDPAIKAMATYDVELGTFIDEADIRFSSISGWKELEIEVTFGDIKAVDCSFAKVMNHEVGHILGHTFHSRSHSSLMHARGACNGYVREPSRKSYNNIHRTYRWYKNMVRKGKVRIVADTSE